MAAVSTIRWGIAEIAGGASERESQVTKALGKEQTGGKTTESAASKVKKRGWLNDGSSRISPGGVTLYRAPVRRLNGMVSLPKNKRHRGFPGGQGGGGKGIAHIN